MNPGNFAEIIGDLVAEHFFVVVLRNPGEVKTSRLDRWEIQPARVTPAHVVGLTLNAFQDRLRRGFK